MPLIITLFVIFAVVHLIFKPGWIEHEYGEYLALQNGWLDTLSITLTRHILTGDYELMRQQLNTEMKFKEKSWKALVVQLKTGEQVFPTAAITPYPDNQYIEKITRTLDQAGKSLGVVTLYADWSDEVTDVNNHITQIETILLLCFFSLLLVALTIQSKLIRSPLEKLQNAASALTHGDYDVELPLSGKDEIGQLSRSFKLMRVSIKMNEDALLHAAKEAEIAEQLLQKNQEMLLDEHSAAINALAETKEVIEKLNQTNNEVTHLRSALDEHAIVSIADVEGNITFVNEKFCKISGYTATELVGRNHCVLKADSHALECYQEIWNTISNGEIWHGNICNRAKNGALFWVEATVVPFLDDNGKPYKYVAIRTDITEQVNAVERIKAKTDEINQAHSDLKKSHQQALQSEKLASVGQLASGIAHEINTPVQFIGDNTRFLQEAFDDMNALINTYKKLSDAVSNGSAHDELLTKARNLSEEIDVEYLAKEVPQAIDQALDGIERVSKIVMSMKNFSHPGSEQKEIIDINQAIQSTITVSSNEWKYHAELVTDFDEKAKAVPCYAGEFNQVILNIIINASHAISDIKQKNKLGTITISTRQQEEFAEIRISDTGTGIPASVRKRIFEPFFTTKGVGKGSGQGLAIAYSVIVEKHGGNLDVESSAGKGTTFIIQLPMKKAAKNKQTEINMVKQSVLNLASGGHA